MLALPHLLFRKEHRRFPIGMSRVSLYQILLSSVLFNARCPPHCATASSPHFPFRQEVTVTNGPKTPFFWRLQREKDPIIAGARTHKHFHQEHISISMNGYKGRHKGDSIRKPWAQAPKSQMGNNGRYKGRNEGVPSLRPP